MLFSAVPLVVALPPARLLFPTKVALMANPQAAACVAAHACR